MVNREQYVTDLRVELERLKRDGNPRAVQVEAELEKYADQPVKRTRETAKR